MGWPFFWLKKEHAAFAVLKYGAQPQRPEVARFGFLTLWMFNWQRPASQNRRQLAEDLKSELKKPHVKHPQTPSR